MKTRLTAVVYLGYTVMDRRVSNSMLPWLLREIRAPGVRDKLSITIEDGCLKAYNGNFEPVILHRLVDILRASPVPGRPSELFYILLDEKENLLQCHLFRASSADEVSELFAQMRDPGSTTSTPAGSTSSLHVSKNAGFQHQNEAEHPPWASPAISLPGNCNSNLTSETPPLLRSVSNASALTSLCADLSPSESHFFEVLYIGKVRISQRKVPVTLIDDALTKFAQHDTEKLTQRRHSLLSSTGTSISANSVESLKDSSTSHENFQKSIIPTTPLEPDKNSWKSADSLSKPEVLVDREFDEFTKERVEKKQSDKVKEERIEKKTQSETKVKINLGTVKEDEEKNDLNANPFKEIKLVKSVTLDPLLNITEDGKEKQEKEVNKEVEEEGKKEMSFSELQSKVSDGNKDMPVNVQFLRDRSASIGTISLKTPLAHLIGEQNRTMLFQVGRSELRLISPDRKQILLHRPFSDVASCVLGQQRREHFGFVCREASSYACYVFKCESADVAAELVSAIKQAFVAHAELLKKSREKSPNMTCEHCPMLWYHRLCHDIEGMNEKKTHAFILRRIETLPDEDQELIITKYQGGTGHIYEVSEHNAFLMMLLRAHSESKQRRHVHDTAENRSEFLNQYLGGSTIFMKAKRSLSSGFDNLLKRKKSKDDLTSIVKKEPSPKPPPLNLETSSEPNNAELLSPDTARCKSLSPAVLSDQHSPKTPPILEDDVESKETTPTLNSPMMDIFLKVSDSRPAAVTDEADATWRQAIYEQATHHDTLHEEPSTLLGSSKSGKRSKEDLRRLWKMAIDQTILLVRMEKENARLKESEESSALRRIKLEYSEYVTSDAGTSHMWDALLAPPRARADARMLAQAVRQGVPRIFRGAVWYFLAEQACVRLPPPDTRQLPDYNTPYRTLLAGLTKYQHAILIDLGRTFPKHSYFASALGPGQLALYNILKAYSLLDPQVGYCQGLSFVAGVLLLHMEEAEAFMLLRHLMFRRGLRKQYLPDMKALQVQLYQLSRLVRDHEPELHAHLDALELPPALYAAPWMLTLFTSHFPLGFVVRVFDLVFAESTDAIFSVSLALLACHKEALLLCRSCEEGAEYLRHKLPDLDRHMYERVMNMVYKLDISRQLSEYAVEYGVLSDEVPRRAALAAANRQLSEHADALAAEMDSAMEALTNFQKTQSRLESQNRAMEHHLTILSKYISSRHDVPPEIKKITQNYTKRMSFSSKISSLTNFSSNEEEEVSTKQKSAPNLFAKTSKEEVLNAMNKMNEDRKHFLMKKSQSVHSGLIANRNYPLKVLKENAEESSRRIEGSRKHSLTDSLILGKKSTGFFANTHEQIRQERLFEQQLKHDFDENLRKLEDKEKEDTESEKSSDIFKNTDFSKNTDLSDFQGKKSLSLNFNDKNDSGFVTPQSPEKEDVRKEETSSISSHPLCDCDVDIKFDGQSTKLKQIRPIRPH